MDFCGICSGVRRRGADIRLWRESARKRL